MKLLLAVICLIKGGDCILWGQADIISMVPFMVSLLIRDDHPNTRAEDWMIVCGGTIVSRTMVLTSGSCVYYLQERELSQNDIIIRGNTEYWQCSCGRTIDHTVDGFVKHPKFKRIKVNKKITIYKNDLGLITVTEEFTGLFEVPTTFTTSNMVNMYVVFGWGKDFKTKKSSPILESSMFYVENREKCDRMFRTTLAEDLFCQKIGFDSCGVCGQDRGGPAMGTILFSNSRRFYEVKNWKAVNLGMIGVISVPGCMMRSTLFVNISHHRHWLEYTID